MDQNWVKHAILRALPEGWDASPDLDVPVAEIGWVVASNRFDLGDFRFRLTNDCQTLIFIHSTDIHIFPPQIQEATLIRLDGFTGSGLAELLRELMRTRRPNLTHP